MAVNPSRVLRKLMELPVVRFIYLKIVGYLPARAIYHLRRLFFAKEKDYSFFAIHRASTKKYNLLFIHPRIAINNHLHKKIYPMGLLYLSSYIKKHFDDINIELLDMQALDLPSEIAREKIAAKKWNAIGFSYFTAQADDAYELSNFARQTQRSLIIHGGVHPMLLPDEALDYADVVVCHEGEETMVELMARVMSGRDFRAVKGIAHRSGAQVVRNELRPFIKDLDSIPFPDWDLLEYPERYDTPMHIIGGRRMPIFGSRGCPFNCTFCSSPMIWKRRVRWRSPDQVVQEMQTIKGKYGIRSVHFWDDNLMMKPSFMEKLCHEILRLGLEMHWVGLTRASHIVKYRDLLPLMKRAGCIGIEIGVESFSDAVAEHVEKGEETAAMLQATEYMEKAGLTPLYTHMLFNPGETIDSYHRKCQFLSSIGRRVLNSDAELGQLATPHRTTMFQREAPQLGKVFCREDRHYIHHRVNFIPFSFLEDVPSKLLVKSKNQVRKRAADFLYGVILPYIIDWGKEDEDLFMRVADEFWQRTDGTRSVGQLGELIGNAFNLPSEKACILTSLAAVCYGREGWVHSTDGNAHSTTCSS